MITLFTIPKPFKDPHIKIIQRNAIQSWLKLYPEAEVILFGDDEGVAETAQEFGLLHIAAVKKNEFGTPLLNSVFASAQQESQQPILVYLNTDIILLSDFLSAIKRIDRPQYLMSGQRWDLGVEEAIDFTNPDWEKNLRQIISLRGKRHRPSGMDYLVFPRQFNLGLPAFAVGRPGWDTWLIYHLRSLGVPVIDATNMASIVHQNHFYGHSPWGKKKRIEGPEFKQNIKLAGGFKNMLSLRDADWLLTTEGLRKPSGLRRIYSELSLFYPWRLLLALKRWLQ